MSRRRLSDDEQALWTGFARAVVPLRGKETKKSQSQTDLETRQPGRKAPSARPGVRQERAEPKGPPPLAQFDRRLRQRVARGQTVIDLRLDLHGMTQKQAHAALLHFLQEAQARDGKVALIVTGKGLDRAATTGGERGVLRRQVPLWLSLPEFRRFIVSFEAAHASHGGEGALYLRLRRRPR
jgi:DNA-nicking Smr family endonuclease